MSSLLSVHGLTRLFFHQIIRDEDLLIDATVGNGYDTLSLLEFTKNFRCRLIGFDIQQEALTAAKMKIASPDSVDWILDSHEHFDRYPQIREVGLFVYNLGYLPTKDKKITTMSDSTLKSVKKALNLLRDKGGISITCYSGHPEGKKEIAVLEELVLDLDPRLYAVTWTKWANRKDCPSVLFIQKI
jgi:hypothetical protein